MGEDSVTPFLAYPGKWTIVLALTSNQGALDFQTQELKESGDFLFQKVLKKTSQWGTADNMMYVVGATRAHELEKVRAIVPDNFLLIPGVGAQGGSMSDVFQYGANAQCGLLINASRSIIYASNGEDFADKAREEAQKMQAEMEILLQAKGLI
jgi:orotidine-5'-phosphate decarboxylase